MKRAVSLALSLIMILCTLASCGARIVKMEYNDEDVLVAENGSEYHYAPVGYEPTSQGEEYGLIESILEEKLYRIGELDPDLWLTTEYMGAATTVYYSTDIDLPALSEMKPSLCYICEQDENVYSVYTLGDEKNEAAEEERKIISDLISMLNDENVRNEIWPRGETQEVYDLKLYSEDWPAIYYNLEYSREGSGNYLYDRVTRRCVNVGDLLEKYFADESN